MSLQRGSRQSSARVGVSIALVTCALIVFTLGAGVVGVAGPVGAHAPEARAVDGIPPAYVAAYERAAAQFELGPDGWSMLAGIGSVESDHGRSPAKGVKSGQNFHGCCAGPMQIHNGFGAGTATWGAYDVDGNGDGR